jgi:fructokinase
VHRPPAPAVLADTVGAGDAFMSGLLDSAARRGLLTPGRLAALDPATLAGLIDEAGQVASFTCGRPGADPPWRAELEPGRGL